MNRGRVVAYRVAIAYALFVLYGSLMPWTFHPRSLDDAMSNYLGLARGAMPSFSLRDFATNLVLFFVLALTWSAAWGPSPRSALRWGRAFAVLVGCCLFSAAIEFAQLFVAPRTSSIHDWVSNTLGAAAGVWAWLVCEPRLALAVERPARDEGDRPAVTAAMRLAVLLAALPYLIAVSAANHWFSWPWLGWYEARARLSEINLLPFYYHQEASTLVALASVLWQLLLYAPIGVALQVLSASGDRRSRPGAGSAAALGVGFATVMECGRLFVAGQHPDSGNVLVAGLAAAVGFMLWRERGALALRQVPQSTATRAPSSVAARSLSLGLLAVCVAALLRFPVLQWPLAVALLVYATALARWPAAWLWVLPAMLPVIDLAPLSGWFFFDEFDLAVLVTLAVALWRRPAGTGQTVADRLGAWSWFAFGGSVAISALVGLLPLQALDANAVASYHSHYNALRIAKGFVWAAALIATLRWAAFEPADAARRLGGGIVLGLLGAVSLAIWERYAYPGLFDFARGHRIGAFFSSMHNGGSHIEAYLVMAVPFLLVGAYRTKSAAWRLAAAVLFVAVTYVLMVTFARGGYAAFALVVVLVIGLLGRGGQAGRPRWLPASIVAGLAIAVAAAAVVVSGEFAQQRLGTSALDLKTRLAHWREAVQIMDPGPVTALFGMGLGQFPQTYLFRNRDNEAPATFRYEIEAGIGHLALGSGDTVYVEQFVDVRPEHSYRLSVDLRSAGGPAHLNVLLCERTYFFSYGCKSATLEALPGGPDWRHQEAQIQSQTLGAGPWWSRRPVKLSLENETRGTTLNLRHLALTDVDGRNLVANGDFAHGSDHWFFSSNFNHLPWHTKNLWVGLFFDQGWLGTATLSLLLAHGLVTLLRAAWSGNAYAAAAFASTVGFLGVGVFDSLFDAPRLSMLFFLVLGGFGWLARGARQARAADAPLAAATGRPGAVPAPAFGASAAALERPTVSLLRPVVIAVTLLAALIALVTHLPVVPYNLRALPNPFHPVLAPVVLAVFFFWGLGLPALAARWLETGRRDALLFPVALIFYAVVAWAMVRQGVLPAMIHKVAGSPVLGWPWEWETLLRFGALQSALGLVLTGGCVAARVGRRGPGLRAFGAWLGWATLLLPLLRYVVVEQAATDNLTELMADGGDWLSCLALALWGVLIGAAGAALTGQRATRPAGRVLRGLLVALSVPLGYALLQSGLEPNVQKFGVSFSGLQFLLSTSRQSYAAGWELGLRYLSFHVAVIGLIALAQWPWRRVPWPRRPRR
jgi:VanZ family protein